jgi:hypothetical protein
MLLEQQREFLDALFAESTADPPPLAIAAGALGVARRIAIYRHNVLTNLVGALAAIYPVCRRIVGEAFFDHAARAFCRSTPSTSGDLNDFGEAWGEFLGRWPYARELPYLPDTARLEWAWHRAFHAADAEPYDAAQLAAVPVERLPALRFRLHPSAAIVDSGFPLSQIWRVNQEEYAGDQTVDWDRGGERILVCRRGFEVRVEALVPADAAFLAACLAGASLEKAHDAALEVDAGFNLEGALTRWVRDGLIVDAAP